MGFFSRKRKAKQEGKTTETQTNQVPEPGSKHVPKHVAEARKRIHSRQSSAQTPTGPGYLNRQSSSHGDDAGAGQQHSPFKPGLQRSMSSHAGKVGNSDESFISTNALGKRPATSEYFYTAQYSCDSGYESADPISALHSRTSNERDLHPTRSNNGHLLPELRLGDEASNSLGTEFMRSTSSNEAVLDMSADTRSIRSYRSAISTKSNVSMKRKTRFQEKSEPMPTDHMEQIRKNSDQSKSASSPIELPRDLQSDDEHNTTKLSEDQQSPLQPSPAKPFSALQQSRAIRRGSVPPLHILNGFKVNKKGKILDEEGEPIGHLVEGELLDCVRQKANAQGEVLDEYGRVVGRVQTLPPSSSPTTTLSMHKPQPSVDSYRPILQAASVQVAQLVHEPAERPTAAVENDVANPPCPTTRPPPVPLVSQSRADSEHDSSPRGRTAFREHVPQIALPAQPEVPSHAQETVKDPEPNTAEEPSSDGDIPQRPETSKTSSRDFAATPMSTTPTFPVTLASTPLSESPNRTVRSASERSLSELSKSYARPAMSSVPEYNIPEEDFVSATPSLFAYKGEIPTVDSLAQQSARMRSKSPIGPVAPTSAYAMPGPSNYMKIAANQSGGVGRASMRPVSLSSKRRSSGLVSSASSLRQPTHASLKKTTYDTSPNLSDSSTDPSTSDDGRMPAYVFGGRSRAGSIGTTASVARPRTYFTHVGRVTVAPSAEPADKPINMPAPAAAAAEAAEKAPEKKKSRISLGFGRKAKAAV